MPNQTPQIGSEVPCYRSGVAARLAGVPVETLRVWERRYGVIGPRLSQAGQRLYSANEVQRLGIIKQLVNSGHLIGSIAHLTTLALIEMHQITSKLLDAESTGQDPPGQTIRVALVGPWIGLPRTRKALSYNNVEVVASAIKLADAAQQLAETRADIAIIEFSVLNETSINTINAVLHACATDIVIIFYRFAPAIVLQQLRGAGYEVIQKPQDSIDLKWLYKVLKHAMLAANNAHIHEPVTAPPAPRFDEIGLADIAASNSSLYCDCTRHLAGLLLGLGNFEIYSEQCANRDTKDAAVHRDLHLTTGHARAALEEALLRLALAEGITLPAQVKLPW